MATNQKFSTGNPMSRLLEMKEEEFNFAAEDPFACSCGGRYENKGGVYVCGKCGTDSVEAAKTAKIIGSYRV